MAFLTTALAKNLLVLFALLLGVILLFLYLALFPDTSTPTLPIDPLSLAAFNLSTTAQPTPIPQLNDTVLTHTVLYRANNASVDSNWTYSHYPVLYVVNGSSSLLLAAWSSAVQDEDSDGERILYAGITTTTPINSTRPITNVTMPHTELFPSALVPGQHAVRNYNETQLVRAMCPDAFLQTADGTLYAVAELYGSSNVSGMAYEGEGYKNTGYGRVARQLSAVDGSIVGSVCWLEPSKYAGALIGTPYATQPTLHYCLDTPELLTLLADPANQPPWSWALESDNHAVLAADGSGGLGEPTHAVAMANDEVCRLWRSFGEVAPLNHTLYIECTNTTAYTAGTSGWFSGTGDLMHRGGYNYSSIVATNLPDANSKAFLGAFPESSGNAISAYRSYKSPANLTHYLVSNPVPTSAGLVADRSPLTVATSVDNGRTFNGIAALQSAYTEPRYPGRLKNKGYQVGSHTDTHTHWAPLSLLRCLADRVCDALLFVLSVLFDVSTRLLWCVLLVIV